VSHFIAASFSFLFSSVDEAGVAEPPVLSNEAKVLKLALFLVKPLL
jgi:hypothetical protein